MLGAAVPTDLHRVISRIGAALDPPRFYPGFTARANLELLANLSSQVAIDIDGVLDKLDLADRADDRFASYSTGMRRRLALGAALIKDPELLILDEPTAGLDAAGIRAVRDIVRDCRGSGRTVFLSSHLLNEVEQLCDLVAIIHRGRIIFSGSTRQLLSLRQQRLVVKVPRSDVAYSILTAAGYKVTRAESSDSLLVDVDPDQSRDILRILGERGLYPSQVFAERVTLEDAFLGLTTGGEESTDSSEDPDSR